MGKPTTVILLSSAILAGRCTSAPSTPDQHFEDASKAATNLDFDRARGLYRAAARTDPDPTRRDRAAIRLANIQWRIDHDAKAAGQSLAQVGEGHELTAAAWIERARMEAELLGDFTAAQADAQRAIALATKHTDRTRASFVEAAAATEPARRARLAGRCEPDPGPLSAARNDLREVVDRYGPMIDPTRLLLDAALLTNDGPTALEAWRDYYGATARSALLAPAEKTLAALLPAWRGADASPDDRRRVGLALADSRLFTQAALVLRDPCAQRPIAADDAAVSDVIVYDAALRRIAAITNEYYRKVALRKADPGAFRADVERASLDLWQRLSWNGAPPAYSTDAAVAELGRRFGMVVTLGKTGNVFDLHLGHRVVDEEREVSQYGRTAPLRFVALDGIVSNGFSLWIYDGGSGDGGWSSEGVIYQVRPMYANGPLRDWLAATDPVIRADYDGTIAQETKRDEERAVQDPTGSLGAVERRLHRQYVDRLLAHLRASGLSEGALRAAFIARVEHDKFESSIWAHEGRHAIDAKYEALKDPAELEFRAKLSEVVFAPAPRLAIGAIVTSEIAAATPHGRANHRIAEGLLLWMRANAAEISGLDPSKPLLTQLDDLTDEQLRSAFRSLDPLAVSYPCAPEFESRPRAARILRR